MAADSYGAKKQPQFAGAGVPQDAADLSLVADYAARVGNRVVGTTTERQQAITDGAVWEGLIWGDTTDGNEYRFTSNAWALWMTGAPRYKTGALYASTTNPNVGTTGYALCYFRVIAGWCDVKYNVYFSGSGAAAGSGNWGLRLPTPAVANPAGQFDLVGNYRRLGSSAASIALMGFFDSNDLSNVTSIVSADGTRLTGVIPNIAVTSDRMQLSGGYPTLASIAA